jgi:DNA-binding NtrC family response regulator/predicted TIM-barrel enzyme
MRLHPALARLGRGRRPEAEGLIAVVAGTGLVASAAVEGGADLLLVLNAGMYRHLGAGTLGAFLPYGNANDQTFELLVRHVLPRAGGVPVVAGVLGVDPTRDLDATFSTLERLGVWGVTNWPALGFIDGQFRRALEQAGWTAESEVEMLVRARARGLATFGFVLDREAAVRHAQAGVDALVLDLGLTQQVEDILERRDQVRRSIARLNEMVEAVVATGRDPLRLVFGGPVTRAEDVGEVLRFGFVHGYAGGSVFERLPVIEAVASTVRRFKEAALSRRQHEGAAQGLDELIGASPPMRQLFHLIERVAPYDVNVCIDGESGVGKELVAAALHRLSGRAHKPFVTLNCGALPDTLVESELFGHERGSFTGADRRRLGKFELAHGGTLFLDEVADLSARAQVALLRALQTREITRIGGERSLQVDVRVLAASNRPLDRLVAEGRFRSDLYFRLSQITLQVPPLRERLSDIPLLVARMLPALSLRLGRPVEGLTESFGRRLGEHAWPGNVRELQHVITRAALLEDGKVLEGDSFLPRPPGAEGAKSGRRSLDRAGRQRLARQVLAEVDGNKSQAAVRLGITRKTLYDWLGA